MLSRPCTKNQKSSSYLLMIDIRTVFINRTLCIDVVWWWWHVSSLTNWRSHHHVVQMMAIILLVVLIQVHLIIDLLIYWWGNSLRLGWTSRESTLLCLLYQPMLVIASANEVNCNKCFKIYSSTNEMIEPVFITV